MKNTTNYGLNQPEVTDYYDVEHQNQNMEIIDEKMKEIDDNANGAKSDVNTHLKNTDNPHGVTKEQVGLGNVQNVSTNNQTPTYSIASTLAELVNGEKLSVAFGKIAKAIVDLISHLSNTSNPHGVTKSQLGLGNVDNTSDTSKPVSTAQQNAIDAAYYNANQYTDQKIANLIGSADSTMDTLGEIQEAMANNQSVVEALDEAIGSRAKQTELDTHTGNDTIHVTATERAKWNTVSNKLDTTGASTNNTVAFTSADNISPTAWTDVAVLATGEKHSSLFNKISTMFKNVRWLYKMLGTTDISGVGDGTVTGALSTVNTNLSSIKNTVIAPSAYSIEMEDTTFTLSLSLLLANVGATYSIDTVWAVVPVGARKSGSTTLYPAIYDGTYVRCNAVAGATLLVYVFHKI